MTRQPSTQPSHARNHHRVSAKRSRYDKPAGPIDEALAAGIEAKGPTIDDFPHVNRAALTPCPMAEAQTSASSV